MEEEESPAAMNEVMRLPLEAALPATSPPLTPPSLQPQGGRRLTLLGVFGTRLARSHTRVDGRDQTASTLPSSHDMPSEGDISPSPSEGEVPFPGEPNQPNPFDGPTQLLHAVHDRIDEAAQLILPLPHHDQPIDVVPTPTDLHSPDQNVQQTDNKTPTNQAWEFEGDQNEDGDDTAMRSPTLGVRKETAFAAPPAGGGKEGVPGDC